jgi:hypothetical protein
MDMEKDDITNDQVNEPEVKYGGSNRLTFFKSFEQEQEAQFAYWRSLTPEQRLEEHRLLSLRIFSAYRKYSGNRLTFD